MSITLLIQQRGSTVSVYRPTAGENADGSPSLTSWSLVSSGVKALFQPITDAMAGKVYGAVSEIRDEAFVAGHPDIQKGDGIVVTAGFRNASRWIVEEAPTFDFGSTNKYKTLGIAKTDVVFP